jgi:hypothetical protein
MSNPRCLGLANMSEPILLESDNIPDPRYLGMTTF